MGAPEKTRKARLRKIEKALKIAVPELQNLTDTRDERGMPHLEALYRHWRPQGGRQREDQFSDGTLRLIGLFWSLLDGDSLLLLEEPELSLHSSIISRLPSLIWRLQHPKGRQVILSSHSDKLLNDHGIRLNEIAILSPQGSEGTKVSLAEDKQDIRILLKNEPTRGDAISALTAPSGIEQLDLFR